MNARLSYCTISCNATWARPKESDQTSPEHQEKGGFVNSNREPTTEWGPEAVVTHFNLLSKPNQQALPLCPLGLPQPVWRGHETSYPVCSSPQLQRKQHHCIVYTLSRIICLQTLLHQPLSLCCPPQQPAARFEQRGWKSIRNPLEVRSSCPTWLKKGSEEA